MGYQIVEIASNLSVFVGVALAACAFLLPNGWRSAIGLLVISLGAAVVIASVTHAPNGQTWARSILTQVILGY